MDGLMFHKFDQQKSFGTNKVLHTFWRALKEPERKSNNKVSFINEKWMESTVKAGKARKSQEKSGKSRTSAGEREKVFFPLSGKQ